MKLSFTLAFLFFTTLNFAQGIPPRTMEFWDGTFAYNKLIVKESQIQRNILTLELTGSTLGLGDKMEGIGETWGSGDKVLVSVRKDSCQTDFTKRTIDCDVKSVSGTVSWTINSKVTKSIRTRLVHLKVKAMGGSVGTQVKFEFSVPSDQYFTPANDPIIVDFRKLSF